MNFWKLKTKKKNLKATEKDDTTKMTIDFLSETMDTRHKYQNIFQVPKENNFHQEFYIQHKLSFRNEGELKHRLMREN